MDMATHLPAPKDVRDLLEDLLGREVVLGATSPFAPGPYHPATIGTYVDNSLRVAALIALDLGLSAHAAAAIGLVPAAGAEDARKAGSLGRGLRGNVHELLNVAASLFHTHDVGHLRLYGVHHAGDPVPQHVQAHALILGRREDLTVDIAGYGKGRFSIVLT
jgi:hypothetical protein